MDFVEVSAKTVNEAITKACIELETASDRLEIQVVSEGSSGFLGFGAKPAVIKVRKKAEPEPELEVPVKKEEPVKAAGPKMPAGEPKERRKEAPRPPRRENAAPREEKRENRWETAPVRTVKESVQPPQQNREPKTGEEIAQIKESAETFLKGVFGAMGLEVTLAMAYNQENDSLDIDFSGDDMGILIGKRGQTLDSLQYLTSLVVNKDQKEYIRVKLDTENYRRRRKETLENLARNIAYKVRKTRRPVSLEPMNPYERRIIHSSLQGNKWVETYSEGKEPYRHVVVAPKR